MYLVDTNVLILALKSIEPDKSFLKKVISRNKLNLSVIAVGEFLSQATPEAAEKLESLLVRFPIIPVDLEVARIAGDYRKKLLQKGKKNLLLDCILAAQAKAHNLVLVTNNKADFPMKDLRIISP